MKTENKKAVFYENEVSDYAQKQGYLDYLTLSKCFNLVQCLDIEKLFQVFDFERINENETSEEVTVFQWYFIDHWGAEILANWLPDEIVYYCEDLNLYIWGVNHLGTSWDYVLTDIKIVKTEYGFNFEKPQLLDNGGDDE